jgi:hypothetical protein
MSAAFDARAGAVVPALTGRWAPAVSGGGQGWPGTGATR